ncbi:MAG: carboxylating nicotinate-nucleotide diphosphorylase [Myxococcota bacterium]
MTHDDVVDDRPAALRRPPEPPAVYLDEVVGRALAEDLSGGDLTSAACVDATRMAHAEAIARDSLVVCGGAVFARAFALVDPSVEVAVAVQDGDRVGPGEVIWRVAGLARSLLAAERVALNFVQRMSGIATLAAAYTSAVTSGAATRIVDTRKTTPGLRPLERYAVRVGGAYNHRDHLGAAVMIKDNHIAAAGGIEAAVARARAYAPHTCRVEVEVASLEQLDEAMTSGVDIVMLDNMDDDTVRRALELVGDAPMRPLVEVSGGITRERIAVLSALGVDVISVGALTHSAPAADISLLFRPGAGGRDATQHASP